MKLDELSPKDAYAMHELLEYYVEQVSAINAAIAEQFQTRGVQCGDMFPTGTASEVIGKLKELSREHV